MRQVIGTSAKGKANWVDIKFSAPHLYLIRERQFKALTSMAPLQYQKQLRLLEARRLMMFGEANVETAAFDVGYASPSQFSREYSRTFGSPPRRDVASFRTAVA